MDYKSTLETLEGFLNASAMCSEHILGAWAILHPLVKVKGFLELVMIVNKAPFSLRVKY